MHAKFGVLILLPLMVSTARYLQVHRQEWDGFLRGYALP
jgi:hypothetical protein